MTDVLLVSLGTTRGLRVADAALADQARAAGAAVEVVGVRIGALDRFRRAYPANDLIEAVAARRATASALPRLRPRSLVFSTVTASLLAPRLAVPYAVRLDSPAVLNRPGPQNAALHGLERHKLARAALVLPWSEAARSALPDGHGPTVVLPPPVVPSGDPAWKRERMAVAYVPDPKAKGLDVLCAAWAAAAVDDARLDVFGIEPERALRHLGRTAVAQPDSVQWRGMTGADEFRAALRRATAFVSAARWEDFGQAPLEALADGALLVTVPSGGAYEALRLARELNPSLVAPEVAPEGLAQAIRAAFAVQPDEAGAYREAAAERLTAYRPEALRRAVAERVLPALLS
jgi:glycosyltransferase involved in cell wall biosynthesis